MPRLTLKSINKALAGRGIKEELVAGEGYYYFCEGDAPLWQATIVPVYRLNHLTLEQWLSHWLYLSGNEKFPNEISCD